MADVIQKIQFRRGLKANLELLLVGDNKPSKGEPIYETDNGKLKIGDGVNNYANLPYVGTDGLPTAIQDPVNGQILVYNSTNQKWVNINAADLPAIQQLITLMNQQVALAQGYAATAGNKATEAGNSAIAAEQAKTMAETINAQTVSYVENKFWWGTLAEYNALTQIEEGTFYFIKP